MFFSAFTPDWILALVAATAMMAAVIAAAAQKEQRP
jgi:hypothetical protein